MGKLQIAGIVVIAVLCLLLGGVIFSHIQIDQVFSNGTTGTDALNQVGYTPPKSLWDLIATNVGRFFDSINPFHVKLF